MYARRSPRSPVLMLMVAFAPLFLEGCLLVDLDPDPSSGHGSYAYVTWSFPPSGSSSRPDCFEAGVTDVEVVIDGVATRYACDAGIGSPGAVTGYLAPGTHDITLRAMDSTGYVYYARSGLLDVYRDWPVSASFALDWAVGGVAVEWSLFDQGWSVSCAEAGYPSVTVNFVRPSGERLYPGAGDAGPDGFGYACGDVVVYSFLPPGLYQLEVRATTGGSAYRSDPTVSPWIQITAGVFPDAADAVSVPLHRAF
jgi:hypothetical protein